VKSLAFQLTDEQIAALLNGEGRASATGKPFTVDMIRWIRFKHGVRADGQIDSNELSVEQVADHFKVSLHVVYYWIERGIIEARRRNNGSPYRIAIDAQKEKQLRDRTQNSKRITRQREQETREFLSPAEGGAHEATVPTCLDRFIQQAMLQVLQERWDPTFSEASFGFRPGRSAHHAVWQAQTHLRAGFQYVVDMDLEKFFDRVQHDKLMGEVRKRVSDRRVVQLIHRYLRAGVLVDDVINETEEGTPQGGPLSPLLGSRHELAIHYSEDVDRTVIPARFWRESSVFQRPGSPPGTCGDDESEVPLRISYSCPAP
jgi:hypothetical protein